MGKKPVSRDKAIDVARDFMSLEMFSLLDYFVCGSIRRGKDVVGDIDLIIVNKKGVFPTESKMDKFKDSGGEKIRTYTYRGVQINVWPCKYDQVGSFILYATGSGSFNKGLRKVASDNGYKLSQYGLFNKSDGKLIESSSEKKILNILGLKYVPPSHRSEKLKRLFKVYKRTNVHDSSYEQRLIGRIDKKSKYPDDIRSILPIVIPVELLKNVINR